MGRSIQIKGFKELEAKLKKNATLDDARTVVKKNGVDLQSLMTRNAVFVKGYSTGATKRSIRSAFTDSNLTVTVEPTTSYASYPEYGTRYMKKAQPFVRPSFNIQKEIPQKRVKETNEMRCVMDPQQELFSYLLVTLKRILRYGF